jgi:type IV secretion system protein VirB10
MATTPTPNNAAPPAPAAPQKPPGALPKNAQTRAMIAVAVIMVLVIAFSSGGTSKPKPASTAPAATDPSQQRILEFKQRIEDEAQKLKAEQEQLAEAKKGLARAVTGEDAAPAASNPPEQNRPARPQTPQDQIEAERAKREYTSLFASNIALSYRKADQSSPAAAPTEKAPAPPPNAIAEALQAYAAAAQAALPHPASLPAQSAPAPAAGEEKPPQTEAQSTRYRVPEELRQATGNQYRLFEGTLLETVLTNRLASYFSGPVNCMVTTDVYSHDRQHLLIPQGSRVLGEVKKVDNFGQERLAVFFHRIVMPDGYSLSLDQFKGLNQIGETGLRDQVNHHYLQTFGVALAIGAVAGFSSASANYGATQTGLDAYRQGTANSLSQSAMQILDKFLNVLPTFTIREGHRIKIYLAGDLLVPAYDNHKMPSDL